MSLMSPPSHHGVSPRLPSGSPSPPSSTGCPRLWSDTWPGFRWVWDWAPCFQTLTWVSAFGREGAGAQTHALPPLGTNGRERATRSGSSWSLAERLLGRLVLPVAREDRNMGPVSEPSLLTCVHPRKPLRLRLGPDLLPLTPGVSCILSSPVDSLLSCLPPPGSPSLLCTPMCSGPRDSSGGPAPRAASSVGDPASPICFYFIPEG